MDILPPAPSDDDLDQLRGYAQLLKMQLATLQLQHIREEFARSRMQEEFYRRDEMEARITRRSMERQEDGRIAEILDEIRTLKAKVETIKALPAPPKDASKWPPR